MARSASFQRVPRAKHQFGDDRYVIWKEAEIPIARVTIIGVNFDPRHPSTGVLYTVLESDGSVVTEVDEDMISLTGIRTPNLP